MQVSDEQWIAEARARMAAGRGWERPLSAHLFARIPPRAPEQQAGAARCPFCEKHPALEVFPRYEVVSAEPLRYCRNCLGFWARRDALEQGLADPYSEHPALRAAEAPARCKVCMGHLDENETCRKCGKARPPMACPSCSREMKRERQKGVMLDTCSPCLGVWFDIGEIARVHGWTLPQGPAASTVDETAGVTDTEAFLTAMSVLLGGFLRL